MKLPDSQPPGLSRINRLRMIVLGLLLAAPAGSMAQPTNNPPSVLEAEPRQWSMSVRWENDTFGDTDRFYTDGISLSVAHSGPSWLDPVANWLPWGEGRRTVGYDLTQWMFTPEDKNRSVPDPTDRPYAGILSVGLALHVEKPHSYHGLKFVTGVVGPWSMAEETQREVHRLVDSDESQGWDYQLENEPIFNFIYEYRHKFQLAGQREQWSLEAFPIASAALGNILTQGQVAGLVRAGYNMPNDFGPTLLRGMGHMPPPRRNEDSPSRSDWGFSVHSGAVANLVLRDITLDGNTFKDSPSVDKEFFVPAAGVGVGVGNRRFQASFTYIFWGKEFENQSESSQYGAVAFAYIF